MNKNEELINDLGVVLRDYTDADLRVDSSKKISAMGALLTDIIAKSGLSPEEVLCHLNGSNEVSAEQKAALEELNWQKKKAELASDVVNLIGNRLRDLNQLTQHNALDVVEMVIICGYEAAGMSEEEIKTRLVNLPEEHARRRAWLDGMGSAGEGEDE